MIPYRYSTRYKRPNYQYAYLASNPSFYKTCYDITIEHIILYCLVYEALLNADLNTSLPTPNHQSFLPFAHLQSLALEMIRINQHIIANMNTLNAYIWLICLPNSRSRNESGYIFSTYELTVYELWVDCTIYFVTTEKC